MRQNQKFTPELLRVSFQDRPNRFVVRCGIENGECARAMLPNPGRLWELLFPGGGLWIAREKQTSGETPRKTQFTVWAVERDGRPVFLHTHKTNEVARRLIEGGRIPGLEGARVVRAETRCGHSRFDFEIEHGGHRFFLEVKSVTLFGNGAAMFPDAVTERGRRHLLELAALGDGLPPEARPVVLFLVHTPTVDRFLPDYHTDLEFARTLLAVRDRVRVLPVAVEWRIAGSELRLGRRVRRLDVPWEYIEREADDRGAYLLCLRLDADRRIEVGQLGEIEFRAGWHVYVGSAMKNLTARIARHQRRSKTFHWHIDYLREHAAELISLSIRSSRRRECDLARALAAILAPGPAGFGSSDCACPTHLFFSPEHPLHRADFHEVLQSFRMARDDS